MNGYMSAREASYKWGVSESRVHKLCQQGLVADVKRFGRSWLIPEDVEKLADTRIKSGKYIKTQSDPTDTEICPKEEQTAREYGYIKQR